MGGCAVEFNQTFVRFAINHISFKAFAVAQVPNQNLLVLAQLDQLSQIGRNSEATFVMQTCARHRGTMNFRFQYGQLHCA